MVTLFSSATCAPCKTVKQYIKSKGLDFTELDVFEGKNMDTLLKLTGRMTTPTILVEDGDKRSIIIGLNYSSLSDALK